MSKSKVANKVTGLQEFLDSLSKPKMKKGGKFPDLTGDDKVTKADILKGRGVFQKGGMSKMANEGFNNAKRTITDGYKGTGAPNPLRSIVKNTAKKSMNSMKPKMGMGGAPPNSFGLNLQPALLTKKDGMDQYYKKGGMVKKKKK